MATPFRFGIATLSLSVWMAGFSCSSDDSNIPDGGGGKGGSAGSGGGSAGRGGTGGSIGGTGGAVGGTGGGAAGTGGGVAGTGGRGGTGGTGGAVGGTGGGAAGTGGSAGTGGTGGTGTGGTGGTGGGATGRTFTATVLSGMAATDHMGQDLDGSGDFGRPAGFTADGLSDLLVGANAAGHAYLFMGSSTGYAAAPTVTFTGATTGFGDAIVNAGDLDGDGLDDIAITSTNDGNGKIFIYSRKSPPASWGSTTAWPATLTDAQANYVISTDTAFTGISFRNLARLGNFDGAGADDLLVAYRLHPGTAGNGSVFVVKGSSSFASMTLPNPAGALEVDGALTGISFGNANIGLGPFLSQGFVSSSSTAGTVYAFAGQTTAGPITAAMNSDSVVGTAADRYGFTLGLIGAIGSSPGALAIGATMAQYVDVHLGTTATGPFMGTAGGAPAATVRLTDSTSGNSFGVINIGGGVKGTGRVLSLIGDAAPDLVLAGQAGVNNPISIVDGSVFPTASGTADVGNPTGSFVGKVQRLTGVLPSGWMGYTTGTIIPDCNGDGLADFAVGEFTTTTAGRVVVFQ